MSQGSSPPTPQNPTVTADTQQQFNTQAATQNNAGSQLRADNPFGSIGAVQTGTGPGGIPLYTSQETLAPDQQALLHTLTGTKAAAGQAGSDLISNANYGNTDPTTAIGNATSGIQGGLMSGWLKSQQPWLNNQSDALDTKLRNQGLSPTPTATNDPSTWGAYEKAMGQMRQTQDMGVAGVASQFQPQAFSEASNLYQMPAQLGENLAGFGSPTMPNSLFPSPTAFSNQPPDYTSAVSDYNKFNMQAWQAQQAQNAEMMKGIFGMAGTIGGGMLGGPMGASLGSSLGTGLGGMVDSGGMGRA